MKRLACRDSKVTNGERLPERIGSYLPAEPRGAFGLKGRRVKVRPVRSRRIGPLGSWMRVAIRRYTEYEREFSAPDNCGAVFSVKI